jgi:hypothetical protein
MNENETQANQHDSFLIADCGTAMTTVALFDMVAGEYRLIARASAPTTAAAPWSDIHVGVRQAIVRISEITGRRLIGEQGELITPSEEHGAGVDYFGAVVSVAEPLQTVVAGLLEDVSVASARHALQTIYAEEIDTFSLADTRNEQAQIQAILEQKPELILLSGGINGGDATRLLKLVETVQLGTSLLTGTDKPHVIFAGNDEVREQVAATLGNTATVHIADNVRPNLETEQLTDVMRLVGELYEELKIGNVSGIQELAEWSNFPLLPTARAFGAIAEYFGALYKGKVLGLDLGSHSVTFVAADAEQLRLAVRSDLGMGKVMPRLLEQVDIETILEWSPLDIRPVELYDFVHNKGLYSFTVPMTTEELYLEQALARQVMRRAVADAGRSWGWFDREVRLPPFTFLVLRGQTLTHAPRAGQTMLMVLDALQPTGIFSIAMDKYGVLPALGLLAPYEAQVVVQTLEGGALVDLGWVIAPTGRANPGDRALRVIVDSEAKGQYSIDAAYGELITVPLAAGEQVQLTLEPERRFDLGFGPGRGKRITVHGGAVGLVVDTRGRPLQLPPEKAARHSLLRQWYWDVGG